MRHSIDAAIDELARAPGFDATAYAEQLVTIFDLATRAPDTPKGTV
jgi:hypothetical protein